MIKHISKFIYGLISLFYGLMLLDGFIFDLPFFYQLLYYSILFISCWLVIKTTFIIRQKPNFYSYLTDLIRFWILFVLLNVLINSLTLSIINRSFSLFTEILFQMSFVHFVVLFVFIGLPISLFHAFISNEINK